jgi:hypothetical protein
MGFSSRQGIGELIFALTICRMDISIAIITLSQLSKQPAKEQYQAVKAVFVYLWHTKSDGLYYLQPTPCEVTSPIYRYRKPSPTWNNYKNSSILRTPLSPKAQAILHGPLTANTAAVWGVLYSYWQAEPYTIAPNCNRQ